MEDLVRRGILRAGEKLPSLRHAMHQHGVSMTTAIEAYTELEDRGLVEARRKSGYFVRPLQALSHLKEPRPSRPKRSAATVTVGALQSRLFDAASVLLGRVAGQFPLVVHLDDLHWCGAQTLALFRHLVRARPRGVLLVGTYRDTTDEITPQLTATLGTLRRDGAVARISLGGLDVVDVGRYVEAVTGRALDPTAEALAHEIAARTGGNPFLVAELWSHLAASCTGTEVAPDTAAVAVPAGVREVVAERVARLSRSGRAVAELAAVGGRQV